MNDTKPFAAGRTAIPRRPSRLKIAAIWLALLIGSFLFGMMVISPLLGAVMSGRDKGNARKNPAPSRATPQRRSDSGLPQPSVPLNAAPAPPRLPEPGITLSPDESDSRIHASDQLEPPAAQPVVTNPQTPPIAASPSPPAATVPAAEVKPAPAPEEPVQRPESID